MKIGLICQNNFFAPFEFVKSALSLKGYEYVIVQSHSVPHNRNIVWERVKEEKDDLLFIDCDMTFTKEDVAKIEKHLETYDIVTGLYVLANGVPAIFERGDNDYEFTEPKKGIFEVAACGAGFLGISRRIHDKLPENPFSNLWEGAIQHGEDVSFCKRAGDAGVKIFCDSSLRLG